MGREQEILSKYLRNTERSLEQPKNLEKIKRYETATGIFWLPTDAPDDVIIQRMIAGEVFEKEIVDEARKYIRPGTVVVDLGACYGQMSVIFSSLVGQDGSVIGFEASPFIFQLYHQNILENKCSNVLCMPFAAWNSSYETLKFMTYDFSHFKSYGCFGIDPAGKGEVEVQTITVDDLEIKRPISLVKIDVQGADLHALRGMAATLRTQKCPVIFEYEEQYDQSFGVTWQQYVDFTSRVGYSKPRQIHTNCYIIMPEKL